VKLHREDYPLPIDRKNMSRLCTRMSIERREGTSLAVRGATSARACVESAREWKVEHRASSEFLLESSFAWSCQLCEPKSNVFTVRCYFCLSFNVTLTCTLLLGLVNCLIGLGKWYYVCGIMCQTKTPVRLVKG